MWTIYFLNGFLVNTLPLRIDNQSQPFIQILGLKIRTLFISPLINPSSPRNATAPKLQPHRNKLSLLRQKHKIIRQELIFISIVQTKETIVNRLISAVDYFNKLLRLACVCVELYNLWFDCY